MSEELKSPEEWCGEYSIEILDPDGWRFPRRNGGVNYESQSFEIPVSREEFCFRACVSTISPLNPKLLEELSESPEQEVSE